MKDKEQNVDSSVAWYKLAQLVSTGEKEKALSMYRLLAYSLGDKAYALQVEGDLLLSFNDTEALTKYQQAAFLYHKENKLIAAAGICEHLVQLHPTNYSFLSMLLEYYAELDWLEKLKERLDTAFELYESNTITQKHIADSVKNIHMIYRKAKNISSRKALVDFVTMKNPDLALILSDVLKR